MVHTVHMRLFLLFFFFPFAIGIHQNEKSVIQWHDYIAKKAGPCGTLQYPTLHTLYLSRHTE